jgi:hypothetical protein
MYPAPFSIGFPRLATVCLLAVSLVASCMGYGPRTIERDRMDYGLSLKASLKQQLLANIVGIRYMDAPIFVEVSSIINQYAISGNVQAGVGLNASSLGSENTATIGGGGRWEDRPTITYAPISGQKFAESLLTPIPPEALFALVQSGWPAEVMFRLVVKSMNGVEDSHEGRLYRKQADPRYRELLFVWTRLRQQGLLGLKRSSDKMEDATIVLYLSEQDMSQQAQQDIDFLRTTLGLRSEANEFKLTYGLIADEQDEIAVLTESILDLMVDLAWQVDVPQEHIDTGRTGSTFIDTGLGGRMFIVHHSEDKPEDAYAAIRDRGYWFYIDDHDMTTKQTFGLLQVLLSLTDAGGEARGPVVSIGR